jgi:CRP-like cAMP-binding protein
VTARGPGRVLTLSRAAFDRSIRSELGLLAKVEAAAGYRETVAAMPLFAKLPPADLDLLLTRLERVAIAEGSAVVREGDAGDSFYLVVSGAYAVSRAGQQLATLGPGDSFGEIALLHDVPRSATVLATTNGELLRLDREGFNDVLLRYLDRAGDIQRLSHLRLEMHSRLDEVAAGASGTVSHG